MYQPTQNFIDQLNTSSRRFRARMTVGENQITDIKTFVLNTGSCGADTFSIGSVFASYVDIVMGNVDISLIGREFLLEAGILFSITTDHPVSLIQHLSLCAGLAVKHGLPMEEGLKAITINAAKICNVEQRVGSLKKGKDADIAVFSANPLEIFTKTLYTIIDGKVVYKYKEES